MSLEGVQYLRTQNGHKIHRQSDFRSDMVIRVGSKFLFPTACGYDGETMVKEAVGKKIDGFCQRCFGKMAWDYFRPVLKKESGIEVTF